jgi:hypothetical protein
MNANCSRFVTRTSQSQTNSFRAGSVNSVVWLRSLGALSLEKGGARAAPNILACFGAIALKTQYFHTRPAFLHGQNITSELESKPSPNNMYGRCTRYLSVPFSVNFCPQGFTVLLRRGEFGNFSGIISLSYLEE